MLKDIARLFEVCTGINLYAVLKIFINSFKLLKRKSKFEFKMKENAKLLGKWDQVH